MRRPIALLTLLLLSLSWPTSLAAEEVERWGIFELSLNGPSDGNPFLDTTLSAQFKQGERVFEPDGFYDGDGTYRVRFMPDRPGEWTYETKSNRPELNAKKGGFTCVKASPDNHGPVRVHNTYYLAYSDGTPYFQVGTTCYAWAHQGDEREQQTLATLRTAPFNKMRMCVFPKAYTYNENEPQYYPFPRTKDGKNDFTRFDPEFFRHFERRVGDLGDLGIEADIIVFHPYDRWGYKSMDRETDDRYLRYLVARLAAYRNVWWSLANEFDLMLKIPSKQMSDWDRFFQIIRDSDPYDRLRSIHNCRQWYDHTKPWVHHASIQSASFDDLDELRKKYKKPLLFDECRYEGNIPQGWGNISAQQMTRHFWLGTMGGAYVGHGETYKHPKDILWWSKGGVLHGESPARIAFLKRIIDPATFERLEPSKTASDARVLSKPGELYLVYFPSPETTDLSLLGPRPYKIDVIDTWEMTISARGTAQPGHFSFSPPTSGTLLRLSAYAPGEKLRPEVKATATPSVGTVPLTVRFSTDTAIKPRWSFGDGSESTESNPTHVYSKPGRYAAKLTVTDHDGQALDRVLTVVADRPAGEPIVRVGFSNGETPGIKLQGKIKRAANGAYDLGDGEPWKWISVGKEPKESLEGLRSFTILGWVKASNLKTGSGGNRIAFNLNHDHSGFDLVHLNDGRLRLAVNQWPDHCRNDSPKGRIAIEKWTFFAVSYDADETGDNVTWYFGDAETPAKLDGTTTYQQGPTGTDSGPLTIGNYNHTLHRAGLDRQLRGELRAIEVFGSRIGPSGVLSLEAVRARQSQR